MEPLEPSSSRRSARTVQTTIPTVRRTNQYKLQTTCEQEQALQAVLWRRRVLYNTAPEQQITWWR